MYARVTRIEVPPEKLDELIQLARSAVLPVVEEQEGYRGSFLFVNRETGRAMSIAFWETEDDMMASDPQSAYYREQMEKVEVLFSVPPAQECYVVAFED